MRLALVVFLALALAAPAVATADRGAAGSSGRAAAQATGGKLVKKKQRKSKLKAKRRWRAHAQGATLAAAAGKVEVKGALTSVNPPTVGGVSCVVPASTPLAGFAVGDVVEMTCVLAGTTWTLRMLKADDDTGKLEVKGPVQALSPLTVNGVSCVVPAGSSLEGLAVGDVVEMKCRRVGGAWTVSQLERVGGGTVGSDDDDHDENDDDEHEDEHDDDSDHGGGGDDD
jgi:hypothetical protein